MLFSVQAFAFENEKSSLGDPEEINDGNVEVIYAPNALADYVERRAQWSVETFFHQEFYYPKDFSSLADGQRYSDLFGNAQIPLYQFGLGLKYNIGPGGLNLAVLGATGNVASNLSGTSRSLSIVKRGIAAGVVFDAIMREPYVAPYLNGQYFDFVYRDSGSVSGDSAGTTAPTTGFSFGILIQLNSLDPTNSAMIANRDFGLNNTYVDIFATQYNTSNASDDPKLESSLNWGAGLRFEF